MGKSAESTLEPEMLLLTLIGLTVAVLADNDVPIHNLLGLHDNSHVANVDHTIPPHHLVPHENMSPKLIVAKPHVAQNHKHNVKSAPKHKPEVKLVPKQRSGSKAHSNIVVKRSGPKPEMKSLKPKPKVSPKLSLSPKPKAKVSPKVSLTIKPKVKVSTRDIPAKIEIKPKPSPKTTHSNVTGTFKPKRTKKLAKRQRGHWPECTIYSGKRFQKNEWGKLYNALAAVLKKENYSARRMEVWSACKQVSPETGVEKWITAFWDTKTSNAHSCGAEFAHDPKTGKLELTSGPACHVESVDLCVSQMKSITKCTYPNIL